MNAKKLMQYLSNQERAIQDLIDQLDEIQVAFNAQYDEFKAWHDKTLDRLTGQVAERLDVISPELRAAIEERQPIERERIDERRSKVREEYLPKRKQAADSLLRKAQAELAQLRALNPQLDDKEEELKHEKAELEAGLEELNDQIRAQSRGLGVVLHFVAITKADRERHRILGKLEIINGSLYNVRDQWERKREEIEDRQEEYQKKWQMESIAVARLQSELDQLDDEAQRENLVLRRAIHHVLDYLDEPSPSADEELASALQEMMELNVQTDAYHEGLASVGGFIGLLKGISSGLQAIHKSIEGLDQEQRMHSAYLKSLSFALPAPVDTFHKQWPALAQQFADEKTIGAHPIDFAAAAKPILEGPLSQDQIEVMFGDLGAMINRSTAAW